MAAGFTHVLGPSSTFGKDLLPRVAALLGVGQISDVLAVARSASLPPSRSRRQRRRDRRRGSASALVVATVRLASYAGVAEGPPAPIEQRALDVALPSHTRFVARRAGGGARPDLMTARRVVSGGRALGSAEGFQLVAELADVLGAALGASRAAVDSGFVANDLQVGQTGKIIAPELYVAVGISGAIQHLTGIKDARTIVAINKDPDAPIFEVADVGLVADCRASSRADRRAPRARTLARAASRSRRKRESTPSLAAVVASSRCRTRQRFVRAASARSRPS